MNKYLIKDIDVDINLEETLRLLPCLEASVYSIDGSCTWVDADCYTHDDGPVELTFTITEVNNMTPEEL